MTFFLKWISIEENLDLDTVTSTDLEIIDLCMSQREGEIALCHLTVPLTAILYPQRYAVIVSEEKGIKTALFKGKLRDLPVKINDWQQRLELFALPINAQQQLEDIRDEIQSTPDWDALFIDPLLRDDPVEALEAIADLFCWDPVSHQVMLSNLFTGRKKRVFQPEHILKDSLSMRVTGLPKPYINVSVVAEWVQEAGGELNLFPLITNKFSSQKINTFTANGLMANWPKAGQLLGRSGYSVIESRLTAVAPSNTGILNLYPPLSEKITFKNESDGNIYLKRTWFDGKLKLGWDYRQRRREVVHFQLKHHSRILQRTDTKKLELTLRLSDIKEELPTPSAASFFETPRGKKAIFHALKIARCHLAASARGIEVVVKVALPQALGLSLDESIEIQHPALPNGEVIGKLIEYKLFAAFEKRWAELKVAVSTGVRAMELPSQIDIMSETPPEGLPEGDLNTSYFVEGLQVRHQATEQMEQIKEADFENLKELKETLVSCATEINIRLKDIRSTDVLERHYKITTPLQWSAP